MNTLICFIVVMVITVASQSPYSINGNLGVYGNANGDVYAGKIKEGIYGAGGRIGGNLGLTGMLGLGRRRRQAFKMSGAGSAAGAVVQLPNMFSAAGALSGSGMISFGGSNVVSTTLPPTTTTESTTTSTVPSSSTSIEPIGESSEEC